MALLPPSLAAAQVPASTLAASASFRSPTSTPAARNASASRSPLLAVTVAGQRLVAVGLRGNIVFSDDAGKTWHQAQVPVESDLVSVHFSEPRHGWAVGHRGVVLESTDAGSTWTRRFADQELNDSVLKHYRALQPAPKSAAARVVEAVARSIEEKSVPSLLDVWFESPARGTIVGTFNTLLRTEDGGKTWTPWMERIDNPDDLHIYAVRGEPGAVYLAGEKGTVWRLDEVAGRCVGVPTGYAGTLFGLVAEGPSVLAFGMRGSVFASDNAGKSWRAVATPRKAGLTAGLRLPGGDVVLADQAGGLIRGTFTSPAFTAVAGPEGVLAFSLAQAADGPVIAAGLHGVAAISLQPFSTTPTRQRRAGTP